MKLPEISSPTYTITLPVTKQKVSYRPFTVKEEKNMIMVMDHGNPEELLVASRDLVSACTFGKLALNSVPMADFEYLFLTIRSKSVGEEVEGTATCNNPQCGKRDSYTMNLNNITTKYEPVDSTFRLTPQVVVTMNYPTVNSAVQSYELGDTETTIAASCVKMLTIDNEVYDSNNVTITDVVEFLESLPAYAYRKLHEFLGTAPKLVYDDEFTCSHCGVTQRIHLEGLENFFE